MGPLPRSFAADADDCIISDRGCGAELVELGTPEGGTIPPNTLAELKRDMERRSFICEQIRRVEKERIERLKQAPNTGPNVMVRLLARAIGIGIETAARRSEVGLSAVRKDLPAAEMPVSGAPWSNWHGGSYCSRRIARCSVVPPAHAELPESAQDHDRGPGAQAADRTVAVGARRHCAGRRRHATGLTHALHIACAR
jgi:hypothetical protein